MNTHPNSTPKLSPEQVLEVLADPRSYAVIGRDYDCSAALVSQIKNGRIPGYAAIAVPDPDTPRGVRLSHGQVQAIASSPAALIEIATRVGVPYRKVSKIKRGDTYQHVEADRVPFRSRRNHLTPDQVELVLISKDRNCDLAEVLGCSAHTVSRIRSGRDYRWVRPDLPRPGKKKGPRRGPSRSA